jgi:competence protein ComEA
MVGFGAVGTDEDLGTILDYLSKNYGVDSSAAPAKAPGVK